MEAGREMLIKTLRWRHTFNTAAAQKETFPEEIFGGVCIQYGTDKEGRPITYVDMMYTSDIF